MLNVITIIKNIGYFFKGALDFKGKSVSVLRNEVNNINDEFLLLLYGDLLGIESPTSYYALELLPYLEEEFEGWERRMHHSKSVWEHRGGQLDMDP